MLHGLYRVYLYAVYIAMLIFAAVGLGMFLQTLLAVAIYKDIYNVPTTSNIVQSGTFAVVALLIATLVGGLHRWLIHRDMQSDPSAKGGAARAFFLNSTEIVALPLGVSFGAFAISQLGQPYNNSSSLAAFALSSLALWVWLDWERQRTQPNPGAASVFQRIHLYGIQLILLFILSANWISSVGQLADSLFYGGKGSNTTPCAGFAPCQQGPNLLSLTASILFILLFWLWYGYLSHRDTTSLFRRVCHFISYGFGFIFMLMAVSRIFTLLLFTILKVPVPPDELSGPNAQYDIVSPLSLGLITVGIYLFWLRRSTLLHPREKVVTNLSIQAITAVLMAATFWAGVSALLLDILQELFHTGTPLTAEAWAYPLALLITGMGYILLDLLLRRRSVQSSYILPLRAFVFALLGGSILAIAIGGAVALYAYSTATLGSPLDNWQSTAQTGLAIFITGVLVAAIYLGTGIRSGLFARQAKIPHSTQRTQPVSNIVTTTTVPVEATEPPATPLATDTNSSAIGSVLDALLAGSISRDEAIAHIEQLTTQTV